MDKIVVPFETFEHLYKIAKKGKLKELRFELIMSSLFPHIMDNINEEMRRQYTKGYAEGLKEGKDG